MSTPVTGTVSWNTPNQATSTGTAISADYNNLAKNVAFLYAKPWITAVMTSGSLNPANSTNPNSAGGQLFATSVGTSVAVTTYQNSPASGAGTFTLASDGNFAPPSNAHGNYRIKAQAVANTSAVVFRLVIAARNVSGTSILTIPGRWTTGATTSSGYREIGTVDAVVPFNVSAWFGTASSFYIFTQYQTATVPSIGAGDGGYSPASSPPAVFTFCQAEFDGSYGSY